MTKDSVIIIGHLWLPSSLCVRETVRMLLQTTTGSHALSKHFSVQLHCTSCRFPVLFRHPHSGNLKHISDLIHLELQTSAWDMPS